MEGVAGSLLHYPGNELLQGSWTHIIFIKALSREKTDRQLREPNTCNL